MSLSVFGLLVLAGIGGGLCGYLSGLASLITYPALLAAGLTPVLANVSNTLGLLSVGVGSTVSAGSRLRGLGRRRIARDLTISLLGGAAGGGLLVLGGDHGFEKVVPWLVLAASLALVLQPYIAKVRGEQDQPLAYALGLGAIDGQRLPWGSAVLSVAG